MNPIFKFGLWALLPMAAVMLLPSLLLGLRPEWMRASEVVGYTTMLLCMSAAYFAQRDAQREQPARHFGSLLAVGVGVSAVAALGFGLLSWGWFAHMGETGVDALMTHYLTQAREGGAGPAQLAELEAYRVQLRNSPLQGAVMGATVFVVGVFESLVGAAWLANASRRRMKAAQAA